MLEGFFINKSDRPLWLVKLWTSSLKNIYTPCTCIQYNSLFHNLAFLSAFHFISSSFQKNFFYKVFTWKTSTQFKKLKRITFISSEEIRHQQQSMAFIWHCLQTYLEKLINMDLIKNKLSQKNGIVCTCRLKQFSIKYRNWYYI